QRESFTQWVIEDLPQVRVADWASVGVQLTNDVGVYERAKLRLLNAAHSTLAYVGLLRGHATWPKRCATHRSRGWWSS
ncbi:protein containing Mannitol dehydrogenase, partial [mine drainage metagenome]